MNRKELLSFLQNEDHFIISTHESPDGDALGSQVSLYYGLKKLGKDAHMVNSDPVENRYNYLFPQQRPEFPNSWLKKYKAEDYHLIVVDTLPDNIGQDMTPILSSVKSQTSIDHHDTIGPNTLPRGYYQSTSSSTCEMIYTLLKDLKIPIGLDCAEAIFTGIVYDTGSFRYKKTGIQTLHIAAELIQLGVSPFTIYTRIYQSNTKASLLLLSRVMNSLEFYFQDRVSVLTMLNQELKETGASFEEAQTLINIPLGCQSVEVSLFFKQDEKGLMKCSLRSKGNYNCLHIAEAFGGGGHETAAGFKIRGSLEDIRRKVLAELKEFFT